MSFTCLIIGVITDKKYLPITRLNFGRTQLETSSGVHTLGRFECSGQVSLSGMPKSCSDLWKIGHTFSGIYSVMGSNYIESVYCDFTKLPYEPGNNRNIDIMHVYYGSFHIIRFNLESSLWHSL